MLSINLSVLHHRADDALQNATYNPRKLALIHSAVALGSSLLVAVVSLLLNRQIADTGGLSGMGLRSILSTIQTFLEFAVVIALPFWEIGIIFLALGWSRKEETGPKTLLCGFRRFRSVLALHLLRGLIFVVIGFMLFYLSSAIFMLTPLSNPVWNLLEPIENGSMTPQEMEAFLTPELMDTMMASSQPMLVIFGILFAPVAIYIFYRLRLAEYALADGAGAIRALLKSLRLTGKKRSAQLLKVDLHFWWYYLVLLLLTVLSFADVLLAELGVALPISADVCAVLFYLLATMGQVVFCWRHQATVSTTYALAYQDFHQNPTVNPSQPKSVSVPWDTY